MINTYRRGATSVFPPAHDKHQEEDGKSITKKKMIKRKCRVAATVALVSFVVVLSLLNNIGGEGALSRFLTVNLGGGRCIWEPAKAMDNTVNPLNTTTLLASYPGSGKRLTWRILEALTGKVSGDDWNLSENGYFNVLSMKTSYPHPEGSWEWEGNMDQFIMLVRNPRFAIPAYHTIRHELDFSATKTESQARKNFVYTERAPLSEWLQWRDEHFEAEMDRWCWFIDFWMEGGMRRNGTDGNPELDWRCFHEYMDCSPKAVISYENLASENSNIGITEMDKMGAVLDSSANVNAIDPEIRPCAYTEVMSRKTLYNGNREGPNDELKSFTHKQLNAMMAQISVIRDKYSGGSWIEKQTAVDLVAALNSYIAEVQDEYDYEVQKYYANK